jgi:hypothetical protein
MAGNNEHLLGFAEVCAALSDRFGTSFELQNTGGNCVTLMAKLECGIELLITDCVGTLSPVKWHLDGGPPGSSWACTAPSWIPTACTSTCLISSHTPAARPLRRPPRRSAVWCRRRWKMRGPSSCTKRREAVAMPEEQYQDLGVQYHVLPADDPLHALNILREAAGLDPLSDDDRS